MILGLEIIGEDISAKNISRISWLTWNQEIVGNVFDLNKKYFYK
jgi:hypothetical protein